MGIELCMSYKQILADTCVCWMGLEQKPGMVSCNRIEILDDHNVKSNAG